MDINDNGCVEWKELAAFFESLQLIVGKQKGKTPKVQAEDVIHNLAGDDDATKCDSKQLAEFLCRQVSPRMRTAPCCYRTPASLRSRGGCARSLRRRRTGSRRSSARCC